MILEETRGWTSLGDHNKVADKAVQDYSALKMLYSSVRSQYSQVDRFAMKELTLKRPASTK
jgi:cell division protein FtsL